jgi:NAD(P)-dependent dehydrogenase (short-subunit alcohol dehydrogenase family)
MRRVAVVTGGGSGIGLAIVEQLAAAGHAVAVLDMDGDSAASAAAAVLDAGGTAVSAAVDVADRSEVQRAYDMARAELGPIEIVVTSAAIAGFTRFEAIDPDDWQRHFAVNVTGTFHCIQLAVPDMLACGWGRIVTISSAAGQVGALRQGHYSATKGAVIAMTKTIALEYAARGVTCNSVAPFVAATPLLRAKQAAGRLPGDEVLARMIPAGRPGETAEVAAAVTFLCSEAAGYVTGQIIGVNGGAVV